MGNKVVKLSLSAEDLLNKTFQGEIRGYNAFEVDSFLDEVLKDYRVIEENYLLSKSDVEAYQKRIDELIKENDELKISNESMKKILGNIKDSKNVNTDNISLLKRIDKLERYLWKLGENPNKIN